MVEAISKRPESQRDILRTEFRNRVQSHIGREGSQKLLSWLDETDFYDCPASSRFHSAHPSGLVFHSLVVHDTLRKLVKTFGLEEQYTEESMAIVALFHDLCKVNCYVKDKRNKKIDGKWFEVPYWGYKDDLPLGHGEKSLYIVQKFMQVRAFEALSIRWHMMWSYDPPTKMDINGALSKERLVLLMASADHLASVMYEVTEGNSYEPLEAEFSKG